MAAGASGCLAGGAGVVVSGVAFAGSAAGTGVAGAGAGDAGVGSAGLGVSAGVAGEEDGAGVVGVGAGCCAHAGPAGETPSRPSMASVAASDGPVTGGCERGGAADRRWPAKRLLLLVRTLANGSSASKRERKSGPDRLPARASTLIRWRSGSAKPIGRDLRGQVGALVLDASKGFEAQGALGARR